MNSNDTDGDCIPDDLEVLRAQADASGPNATARLTMADADADGVDDHTVEGCTDDAVDPIDNGNTNTDGEQNQTAPDDDVDLDGVPFADDRCPATPQGDLLTQKAALRIGDGCSKRWRRSRRRLWLVPSVIGIVGLLVVSRGPWAFATRTTSQI